MLMNEGVSIRLNGITYGPMRLSVIKLDVEYYDTMMLSGSDGYLRDSMDANRVLWGLSAIRDNLSFISLNLRR